MLPSEQVVAYPLLLAMIYGVYRVGRGSAGLRTSERFEWLRLATLAAMLGLVIALQTRFVAAGYIQTPFGMMGAVSSIAGVFGLVGINLLDIFDARRARANRVGPAAADASAVG